MMRFFRCPASKALWAPSLSVLVVLPGRLPLQHKIYKNHDRDVSKTC